MLGASLDRVSERSFFVLGGFNSLLGRDDSRHSLPEKIMSNSSSIERRTNRRLPIRVMVEYETTEDFLFDYTANVSIGGMFIATGEPLQLGTRFRMRFRLPNRKKPIETYAVVRWVVDPEDLGGMQAGMGVQFEELTPKDHAEVLALIQRWEDGEAVG